MRLVDCPRCRHDTSPMIPIITHSLRRSPMIQILTSQPSSLKENMFFHKWPSIWRPHSRRAMISNPNKRLANWQRLLEWPLLPFKYWNETACPQIPWWNGKVAAWNPSIDFESEMSASHYVTSLCHCSTFPCFTILRILQSEASIAMRQRLDSYGIMFTAHGAKQCKAFLLGPPPWGQYGYIGSMVPPSFPPFFQVNLWDVDPRMPQYFLSEASSHRTSGPHSCNYKCHKSYVFHTSEHRNITNHPIYYST